MLMEDMTEAYPNRNGMERVARNAESKDLEVKRMTNNNRQTALIHL